MLARGKGAQGAIIDTVKRQIATVNGDQPVMSSSTLEERLWENGWARQQFVASLFSACAGAWTESSLWNPVSLAPSVLVLGIVGCCAVLIPAWRNATLDPMRVLRADE